MRGPAQAEHGRLETKQSEGIGPQCRITPTDRSIKPWRSAASESVLSQNFDRSLFNVLVSGQASKVEAGKVENRLSIIVNKLRTRPVGSLDDWDLRKIGYLLGRHGRD